MLSPRNTLLFRAVLALVLLVALCGQALASQALTAANATLDRCAGELARLVLNYEAAAGDEPARKQIRARAAEVIAETGEDKFVVVTDPGEKTALLNHRLEVWTPVVRKWSQASAATAPAAATGPGAPGAPGTPAAGTGDPKAKGSATPRSSTRQHGVDSGYSGAGARHLPRQSPADRPAPPAREQARQRPEQDELRTPPPRVERQQRARPAVLSLGGKGGWTQTVGPSGGGLKLHCPRDSEPIVLATEAYCTTVDHQKVGPWIFWYSDGRPKAETTWRNGQKEGLRRAWGPDGKLREEEHFSAGLLDGPSRKWNERGTKVEEITYRADKRHGLCQWWYDTGKPKAKERYLNGSRFGITQSWYEDGQAKERVSYSQGKHDGLAEFWYASGIKSEETRYRDGQMNGARSRWATGGQLTSAACYVADKEVWRTEDPEKVRERPCK